MFMAKKVRLPRKLKKDAMKWLHHGAKPSMRLRRWALKAALRMRRLEDNPEFPVKFITRLKSVVH